MSLRQALIQQLLTIVDTELDHEIGRQPSCRLSEAEFFQLSPAELAPAVRHWLQHDLSGLARRPEKASVHSQPLKRSGDERFRLLGDFYQRASLCSVPAADAATWQGRRVVEMLRARRERDAQLIEALASGGDIVVAVPAGRMADYYAICGAVALRRLLWNNLVRAYTCLGMGHVDLPHSDEERMALSLIEQGLDTLFFLFANQQVILQIDGGTRLFIHGIDSANVRAAIDALHMHIDPRTAPGMERTRSTSES